MTVLFVILLWAVALVFLLVLVGGVRRGDALRGRAVRELAEQQQEPGETPILERSPRVPTPLRPSRAHTRARSRGLLGS